MGDRARQCYGKFNSQFNDKFNYPTLTRMERELRVGHPSRYAFS
jgi:hypothetical protein